MKQREGQALIIVVLIVAIVMAVFASSYTTRLHYHALEETEIYQREQALYLAEMGINQIIFNINKGITYNDGDSITNNVPGIGTYTTTYHTPDDSGYGGSAYVESVGTVGEISRKIFASVQAGGNSSEAFKYCLYTSTGGRDGIADDSYFYNYIYNNTMYKYNANHTVVPYPDTAFYNKLFAEKYVSFEQNNNQPTYTIQRNDLKKKKNVIYVHTEDKNATLTIDFQNISRSSFRLSIITDAKNVIITNLYPHNSSSKTTWSGAKNSKDNNSIYPIITHLGNGTLKFDLTQNYTFYDWTLKLHGFLYTAGGIDMEYVEYSIPILGIEWGNHGEIDGEVIEKNPQGKLGGQWGDTSIKYVTDYYTNPPPHFIVPNDDVTKVFPGSFREEY